MKGKILAAAFCLIAMAGFAISGQFYYQYLQADNLEAGNTVLSGSVSYPANTTKYTAYRTTTVLQPAGLRFVVINGTGAIISAATPAIATTKAQSGQELVITGGANSVTFRDNGSLSGSLLELASSSRALATGDMLTLRYHNGKWYEVSYSDN